MSSNAPTPRPDSTRPRRDATGPRTVPDMARARRVSRQHIQSHVNELLERGLVEHSDNPAHSTSHLVSLTSRGRKLVGRLRQREQRVFGSMSLGVSERRLRTATEVLTRLRETMESPAWEEEVRREARR